MGRFNYKEEDFDKIKTDAEKFYNSISEVLCPYFGSNIAFNAKGIRHLKFKNDQQARMVTDQYVRLKLIHLAPEVLKLSRTVQGIWETSKFETQKTNTRWERTVKKVTYYEFIAVLENIRIKVIVKDISGGEKHFWSIIPFWGLDRNNKRILYSGNLEED